MNIQSEIDFFSELAIIDKARFLSRVAAELAEDVKGAGGDPQEMLRLRFVNEINQRLMRLIYQMLSEDLARPRDDVILRMLLGARADKSAERLIHGVYSRVVTGFDSHDTTVLLNNT